MPVRSRKILARVMCLSFLLICSSARAQPVRYVDDDGAPGNGCTSWADACPNLQTALGLAGAGDQVWVAAGIYKPAGPGGLRTATFQLESGVAVYGGFDGTEIALGDRAGLFDQTILSGDLNDDDAAVACTNDSPDCDSFGGLCGADGFCIIRDNNDENSYHVVTGSGTNNTAVLDGFTITGGNANFATTHEEGGGMKNSGGSPIITNCRFLENQATGGGGGMDSIGSSGPILRDCEFRGNVAVGGFGGAMRVVSGSDPVLVGCTFIQNAAGTGGGVYVTLNGSSVNLLDCSFFGNTAGASAGGVLTAINATLMATNCVFSGNTAGVNGGAIQHGGSLAKIANCTFSGNTAGASGGGIRTGTVMGVDNCIFWDNADGGGTDESAQIHIAAGTPTVDYSIVQDGWTGTGSNNSSANPLFVDAEGPDNIVGTIDDDLRLQSISPAIDAGDSFAVPADAVDLDGDGNTAEPTPWDLGGQPRFLDHPLTADSGAGSPPVVDMGAYEFAGSDCNGNGIPDSQDIADCFAGDAACQDCDDDWILNSCEIADCRGDPSCADCNGDGIPDGCGFAVECDHTELQKLLAFDGHPEQRFGWGVGIWQDRAVISGVFDDDLGMNAGALYVFDFNGSQWIPSDKLLADDGTSHDWLGNAAAIEGNRIIGGAPNPNASKRPGAVFVFEFTDGSWSQTAKLTALDGADQDFFGGSAALSGNRIIAGAMDDDDLGISSGSAYVFEFNGNQWNQVQKLMASDGAPNDVFGLSVAISGDVAIVGAPYCLPTKCEPSSEPGAAYIFRFNGANWVEEIKLTASDAEADDRFGQSVAIEGNRAVVGAQYGDGAEANTGSLYVFEYNGSWQQTTELFAADGTFHDAFGGGGGSPLALSGNRILVGASTDEPPGGQFSVGSAYLFEFDGASWSEVAKLTATDTGEDDIFGLTVALEGDTAIISAGYQDDLGERSGAAYYFDFTEPDCNCNAVADVCDLNMGTSQDCNGNGVPDECDLEGGSNDCNNDGIPDECQLAGNDCDTNGVPDECQPDCNLNAITDACDIADGTSDDCNHNGVPDECDPDVDPMDGLPDDCTQSLAGNTWTTAAWQGLDLGQYPDNVDSEPNLHVTLSGATTEIMLDETVVIETFRILQGATLEVNQTGAEGDFTVIQPEGILNEGNLLVGDGRTIDVSAGAFTVQAGGVYQAHPEAPGPVRATLTADAITVVGADPNAPPSFAGVSGPGSIILSGSMVMNSDTNLTLQIVPHKGDGTPPPSLSTSGSASISIEGDLVMLGAVELDVNSSNPLTVGGNFQNYITLSNQADHLFNWSSTLLFTADSSHTIEAASEDRGPWPGGMVDNFVIGTLELAPNATLTVVDVFDNQEDGVIACDEALYIGTLILQPGSTLISDGCPVYYGELQNDGNGGTISGSGIEDLRPLGDINDDGCVNALDLAQLLGAWGNPGCNGDEPCLPDFDSEGAVGALDLPMLLGNWGCE